MARRREGGGTPATVALTAAGVAFALHPYEHDPAAPSFGLEAATALGVDPGLVFKTLLVTTEGGPAGPAGLAVAVVPVSCTLDLKAVAAALEVKRAVLAQPSVAERSTGYVVGGISPVGQRRTLPTVVDASALEHPRIYVSGGRRGLDIALSPRDLVEVTGGSVAAVARQGR